MNTTKMKGGIKMRIDYNVRGERRKSLVAAISQELQVPEL